MRPIRLEQRVGLFFGAAPTSEGRPAALAVAGGDACGAVSLRDVEAVDPCRALLPGTTSRSRGAHASRPSSRTSANARRRASRHLGCVVLRTSRRLRDATLRCAGPRAARCARTHSADASLHCVQPADVSQIHDVRRARPRTGVGAVRPTARCARHRGQRRRPGSRGAAGGLGGRSLPVRMAAAIEPVHTPPPLVVECDARRYAQIVREPLSQVAREVAAGE